MMQRYSRARRIAVLVISLGLCVSAGRTIFELWQRKDVLRERESELQALREENRALEHTLQDIGGESYVERIARDQLGLVREGETMVILPDAGRQGMGAAIQGSTEPNWKKWWRLFF